MHLNNQQTQNMFAPGSSIPPNHQNMFQQQPMRVNGGGGPPPLNNPIVQQLQDQNEINQDDAWTVIRSYFKQHGLVSQSYQLLYGLICVLYLILRQNSQQISSFDRFVNFSLQEIISENGQLQIPYTPQYQLNKQQHETDKDIVYEVQFKQASVNSYPRLQEEDDTYSPIFPHEARMRNLTYANKLIFCKFNATEVFVDITLSKKELDKEMIIDPKTGQRHQKVKQVMQEYDEAKIFLYISHNYLRIVPQYRIKLKQSRVTIGKIPVMLRSKFCQLHSLNQMQRMKEGKDCQYDQGGYFIINGSEKVIVAQERMANNQVNVFHKKPPSKYSWVAEIRSQAENSNKPPQQLLLFLKSRYKSSGPGFGQANHSTSKFGQSIYVSLPMIKEQIPLVILFRALGTISDRQILSRVCFDCPDDPEMGEALRASLEESKIVDTQEDAMDYIAKRGSAQPYIRENRLTYTKLMLESEFLPHISTLPQDMPKKSFFLGYMVNKLLKAFLGRIDEDDRDYYGKKRLDMAGSLLATNFRQLFRNFTDTMRRILKHEIDSGKEQIVLQNSIKQDIITRGLRTALATGNWGRDKNGDVQKTGVAQVLNRLTFASSLSHLRRLNTPIAKTGFLKKLNIILN